MKNFFNQTRDELKLIRKKQKALLLEEKKITDRFFNSLSRFENIRDYFDYFNEHTKIISDVDRAQFICILLKEKNRIKKDDFDLLFSSYYFIEDSIKEINKTKWKVSFYEIEPYYKNSFRMEMVHDTGWDSSSILYIFDCSYIFTGSLFKEETKNGRNYCVFNYSDNEQSSFNYSIRNTVEIQNYVRIIIDNLFKKMFLKKRR